MNENILLKKQIGYTLKIGQYLSQGIQKVISNFGLFFSFTVLMALIATILSLIPILGPVIGMILIVPSLTAGFYTASQRIDNGNKLTFGHFFEGFRQYKQLALIQLSLIILVIFTWLTALYLLVESTTAIGYISWFGSLNNKISNFGDLPFKEIFIVIIFGFLIPVFCYTLYSLSVPILLFEETDFWSAMKHSRELTKKHIISFFLLFIFGTLLYFTIQWGLSYLGMKWVFSSTNPEEKFEYLSILSPGVKNVGKLVLVQLFATIFAYLLLPFYHCIIFSIFKDIKSENDLPYYNNDEL